MYRMEKERRKEEEVGSFICIFWGIQIDAIFEGMLSILHEMQVAAESAINIIGSVAHKDSRICTCQGPSLPCMSLTNG